MKNFIVFALVVAFVVCFVHQSEANPQNISPSANTNDKPSGLHVKKPADSGSDGQKYGASTSTLNNAGAKHTDEKNKEHNKTTKAPTKN